MRKFIIFFLLFVFLGAAIFIFFIYNKASDETAIGTKKVISPFVSLLNKEDERTNKKNEPKIFDEPISILLLGIDRRSRDEYGYRTDIMIQLIVNPQTNKVVIVSIPRDLWYEGGRINALFVVNGWEGMQNAFFNYTGYKPQRYILTDFKDFSWVVDAMGGVTVDIDTTFTDYNYPIDETLEYQTISFTQGQEKLTGDRALIYARSRKGDNGEGSDWMRMRRQHKILKGMLSAVVQPGSLFNPMIVEKAFTSVTSGKMDTNLNLIDAKYLWDFYKDKDKYEISSLYLDYDFLYSPPLEEYGGAWVLTSLTGSYDEFKNKITNIVNGTQVTTAQQGSSTNL
ncbi:hypothetical protein A2V49_03140 [candidate division WWE3 bacterium RBG_19FT_COMBO_34_6]|uniref:Cell envelope-related transcriptional attenuator domain-containing protein n=1 Tax=candidate division WWE3 bacterium RBG_19FT_COMBO_34_6 TaxID=1802612 RepID=A0A1F4UK91_UNCKA|nr:MAG: hypothetical protein A2V49_03140 [candidate division WWE3 bacterium RBG_19FT_COMBO_34_6]